MDFRLFRATELAFAIRPKDGVARQGRRGGFHCYIQSSVQCIRNRRLNSFALLVSLRSVQCIIMAARMAADWLSKPAKCCGRGVSCKVSEGMAWYGRSL